MNLLRNTFSGASLVEMTIPALAASMALIALGAPKLLLPATLLAGLSLAVIATASHEGAVSTSASIQQCGNASLVRA